MSFVDSGGAVGLSATSAPSSLANGTTGELAMTADRRIITADANESLATWGASFAGQTGFMSLVSTAETPILMIQNPSNSGKIIRIKSMIFFPPLTLTGLLGSTVTSQLLRFYASSTPGTQSVANQITHVGARQVGQQNASALAYRFPTITTLAGLFAQRFISSVTGTELMVDFAFDRIIDPGSNLVVTTALSAINLQALVNYEFSETAA